MKITIESTSRIVTVNGIECRVWQGESERGVRVQVVISRIAADGGQDCSQFDQELREHAAPTGVQAFPLRMLI